MKSDDNFLVFTLFLRYAFLYTIFYLHFKAILPLFISLSPELMKSVTLSITLNDHTLYPSLRPIYTYIYFLSHVFRYATPHNMEDMYRHLRVIHFNVGTEQTTWNSMPEDRDIRRKQI